MSTRGAIGFARNGANKLTHSLFAATAASLGYQAMQFVREHSDDQMKNLCDRISVVDESEMVPAGARRELRSIARRMVDAERKQAAERKYPATWRLSLVFKKLSYNSIVKAKELTWHQFFRLIGYDFRIFGFGLEVMTDASSFPLDEIWCENVAVIDLDNSRVEVYTYSSEHETDPRYNSRWPDTQHLIVAMDFAEIRGLEDLVAWWNDFEERTGID